MTFRHPADIAPALLSPLAAAAFCMAANVAVAQPSAVAALADDDRVQTAMTALVGGAMRDIEILIELTEIPAPPFGEGPRAARFADMLRESGLSDVEIDDVGNVIARRPGRGDGPTVALIAHIDTVFPEGTDVTVEADGNEYRAPGVADDTRGLVDLLAMIRALDAADIETTGDLLFVGSVGEEGLGDLRGVKHLFREGGPQIDSVIVIDGHELSGIRTIAVGSVRYRVAVSGPGGHSWGDFGMANPHIALGRIMTHFDDLAAPVTEGETPASYSVGRIGGGTSINSIPFESWMEVDMRSTDTNVLAALDNALQEAAALGLEEENNGRTEGPEISIELRRVGLRPAGQTPRDARLVETAVAAMAEFGIEPDFKEGSTDANVPISLGVPAITLARGGASGGAHSLDEWWRDEDSHLAMQISLLTALSMAGLAD